MRWSEHRRRLNKGDHVNPHLQAAWKLYGQERFIFSVIDECRKEDLSNREIYWINHYEATNQDKGYNMVVEYIKSSGEEGRKREERMVACIESITGEVVVLESAKEVAEILSYKLKAVQECLSFWRKISQGEEYSPARNDKRTIKGFILVYLEDFTEAQFYLGTLHPPKIEEPKYDKRKDQKGTPISAINIETGEVREFQTKKSMCRELNLLLPKVQSCINPDSTSTQHRGWKFEQKDLVPTN